MTLSPALLADIWFWLIGVVLIIYVVLDGFDLGAGMLFLWTRDKRYREAILGGLGYTWHANQTWLVVTGGLLFGAFPLVYGVVLSALYIPFGLLLLGLIFRGVSFEFREESHNKMAWNAAFGGGSLLAALAQGFILGGVLTGLPLAGGDYAGGVWNWLNPFTLLVSVGLACGYVQLGTTYLLLKTDPEMHGYLRQVGAAATFLALFLALGAVIWSLSVTPWFLKQWFSWPGLLITTLPFLVALVLFFVLLNTLRAGTSPAAPFILAALIFVFAFLSLGGSLHPVILPPQVSVYDAASPPLTLKMMLAVIVPILPVMILYNIYQYRVFSGRAESGYGESP
ncbi:MAG: cytochrome d ubiquinol oxidase subunit II [Thermodesulfobacteriota bacterium]